MQTFYNNKPLSTLEPPRSRILSRNTKVTIDKEIILDPQSEHRLDYHLLGPHDAKDGTQEIQLAHTILKADQGDKDAQVALGDIYMKGRGVLSKISNIAMNWYTKAAEQGISATQRSIDHLYDYGYGIPIDYLAAMKWYKKAAEKGDLTAQNNIGNLYLKGHGVQQDYSMAMTWYKKAANQGDAIAQINIGHLYRHGHGVKKDKSIVKI
ncbi:hypothetical protein FBU30_008908 [Linnemannia zychae]|nr:hypothetical protein FBU30_008908 [Linnemannia zychae]